jgi:hypothetical protein
MLLLPKFISSKDSVQVVTTVDSLYWYVRQCPLRYISYTRRFGTWLNFRLQVISCRSTEIFYCILLTKLEAAVGNPSVLLRLA